MIYEFKATIFLEGNRTFAEIPFNVWEKLNLKGSVPCRASVDGLSFECKLIPKGNGKYFLPVPKTTASALTQKNQYDICFEPIAALTRINRNSPYSKENPVRKIDSVTPLAPKNGCCGHLCVAMLAGVPLDEVITLMGKGHASWSKILEALDYYGISYAQKPVYTKGKAIELPPCCIVNADNAFALYYDGVFYGADNVSANKLVSYIKVFTN